MLWKGLGQRDTKATVGLAGIFSQECGLTARGKLHTVDCDKV